MSIYEKARVELTAGPASFDDLHLRESYPALANSIAVARQSVADFATSAGADDEQIHAIRLAVTEAMTNVVLYAYPWRTGHIHITGRIAGDELWLLIADSGCGIHAGRDSEGLGLGLALISHLTDGFSVVERSCGGTELRLRFALPASANGRDGRNGNRSQSRGSEASASRPASSRFSTTT